jgi:hypothetical protein
VPLRQRHVDVRREALSADELIERGVRRIHDVAQVERAALLAVAGFEGERREKSAARLAHARRGAFHGQVLLRESEVVPDRLGDDVAERVGGGLRRERGGEARQRESECSECSGERASTRAVT